MPGVNLRHGRKVNSSEDNPSGLSTDCRIMGVNSIVAARSPRATSDCCRQCLFLAMGEKSGLVTQGVPGFHA